MRNQRIKSLVISILLSLNLCCATNIYGYSNKAEVGLGRYSYISDFDSFETIITIPSADHVILPVQATDSGFCKVRQLSADHYGLLFYSSALQFDILPPLTQWAFPRFLCNALYAEWNAFNPDVSYKEKRESGKWNIENIRPEYNIYCTQKDNTVSVYCCYATLLLTYNSGKDLFLLNDRNIIRKFYDKSDLACICPAPQTDDMYYVSLCRFIQTTNTDEMFYSDRFDHSTNFLPPCNTVDKGRTINGVGNYVPVEIPDTAYGMLSVPNQKLRIPVEKASSSKVADRQFIIDKDDCALWTYKSEVGCYWITDHFGSLYSQNYEVSPVEIWEREWDVSKVQIGDNAYLTTQSGITQYRCYATARCDYRGFYLINGAEFKTTSSHDIICSCCVISDATQHYVAYFTKVEK